VSEGSNRCPVRSAVLDEHPGKVVKNKFSNETTWDCAIATLVPDGCTPNSCELSHHAGELVGGSEQEHLQMQKSRQYSAREARSAPMRRQAA